MANEVAVKMPPLCGIYMIINELNGNQYIGQSIDILRRYNQHLSPFSHGNKEFHDDIQRQGKDYFDLFILEECDKESLNEREEYYIRKFRPYYNKSMGQGQKGMKASLQSRKLISEAKKRYWSSLSEEQKALMVKNLCSNHRRGYTLSEETKTKIAMSHIGLKRTKESIEHQKATWQKKKAEGYKHDCSKNFKPIICTTTGKEFSSLKEASKEYGIYSSDISNVLKGKQKTVHGFHFKYKEV